MSTVERIGPDRSTVLSSYPEFELRFQFDDVETPREVTIYPAETDAITTTWITIDIEHAIALDDAR